DITSFSSYAKNLDFLEWGYNRDREKLPQINFGVIYGEPSEKMKEGTAEDDELTARLRLEEEPAESERAAMPVYSLNEAFSRVKNLIEASAGNIISVEYKTETGIPHYITAEIPAENYTSFLERLYQIGEPEEIPASEDMKDQGLVLLQLELILSF
ncbi:unnamed protein product, partial [marine sediment metagenome]